MLVAVLIRVAYALLAAIALLFELVPWTREAFVKYGKTRNIKPLDFGRGSRYVRSVAAWFAQKTVSKNAFVHFYSTGVVLGCILVADLVSWSRCRHHHHNSHSSVSAKDSDTTCLSLLRFCLSLSFDPSGEPKARSVFYPHASAILAFGLYNLHILLRLKESIYDQPKSNARIHIGQFGVGIIFYMVTPLAVFVDSCYMSDWQNTPPWMLIGGLSLYLYASVHQWRCHHILFRLRGRSLKPSRRSIVSQSDPSSCASGGDSCVEPQHYSVPMGGLFNYVSNPHYLCEIIIYASLWMLTAFQERTLLWTLIWTAINLGITSRESHLWYRKTFGSQYPRSRRALIPLIW